MRKNIKTIIIDDNEDWRENLTMRVEAHPTLSLLGCFESPIAAYSMITEGGVDLMLLDVEMPNMNGIEFVRYLPKPPMTILITAHRDFAVEGYEIQAIDYLVKPFGNDRFIQAIHKVQTLLESKTDTIIEQQFFFIKENNSFIKVEINHIVFVKSMENYVQIITPSQTYTTLMSLATVIENLPSTLFLRVHRSFLVNISKITVIQKAEIFLGSHKIPIGRAYANSVFETLIKTHLIGKN